jgi:hypothetical protein
MLKNHRFLGAWELVSFESRRADGSVVRPWGPDPLGVIIWDGSGHMAAQLGPRDGATYVAYFGTLEADDVPAGTLTHHVTGASSEGLRTDQVRTFRFLSADEVVLSPPPAPDGTVSTASWRRFRPGA